MGLTMNIHINVTLLAFPKRHAHLCKRAAVETLGVMSVHINDGSRVLLDPPQEGIAATLPIYLANAI